MELVIGLALAVLVKKFIDFVKFLTNGDWNSALTQVAAWVVGVFGTYLVAQSELGDTVAIGNQAVADLSPAALILVGLVAGSTASVIDDLIAAFGQILGRTPHLVPGLEDTEDVVMARRAAVAPPAYGRGGKPAEDLPEQATPTRARKTTSRTRKAADEDED